jgi:hypothetical protein
MILKNRHSLTRTAEPQYLIRATSHLQRKCQLPKRDPRPDPPHRSSRGCIRSLGDPLFDTTTSQVRLLVTMLAAVAEFERELIRERTGEGRKRAMQNGVRFGRKPKLSDFQRKEPWLAAVMARRWRRSRGRTRSV